MQFIQDSHWKSQNPLLVLSSLSGHESPESLTKARNFWIEHETRRRVLLASLILDTQLSVMFEQSPIFLQMTTMSSNPDNYNSKLTDLPFPCTSKLWESYSIEEWLECARDYKPLVLSSVAQYVVSPNCLSIELDPFQLSLIFAHIILANPQSSSLEQSAELLIHEIERGTIVERSAAWSPHQNSALDSGHIGFTYHSFLAIHFTPLRSLLAVSGESWLLNRKIPLETVYEGSRQEIQSWISDTADVRKAVWHATRALQYMLENNALNNSSNTDIGNVNYPDLERGNTDNTVSYNNPTYAFTARGHGVCHQYTGNQEVNNGVSDTPTTFYQSAPGPLCLLHANWALYVCALICWAYGTEDTGSNMPPSIGISANSAHFYISTMVSLTPSWVLVSRDTLPSNLRRDTTALLEYVRVAISQQNGAMGGLLSEAKTVLQRLIQSHINSNVGSVVYSDDYGLNRSEIF